MSQEFKNLPTPLPTSEPDEFISIPDSEPDEIISIPNSETASNTADAGEGRRKPSAFEQMAAVPMQWPLLVLGLYFAAASTAVQALQTKLHLPIISQLVYSALVLSFIAVLVSIDTSQYHELASIIFFYVGFFFAATALVVALVCNLHSPLMWVMVAIYASAIVAIIFIRVSKLVR